MKRIKEQQSQRRDEQQSTEERAQALEKKQLTLEDLASVTGGFARPVADASVKLEDSANNKGEAE
ncbi:hypothetical protein [Vitiosangium sp. GDMCC 1.1324]|uniref:hypothetical protein n=1 Tax=Vitiosangium sp. (strain GDMCC 1.1324) TaxID=2138576 RepID=UPI000D3779EE|nr:hypothetical protein [Vitiosangium sp. GDMCC 1.1324]PTL80931.1 hypothetical protein DAT35_26745 [Vitiosangium sp. GDMCC 1.1324]